MEYELRALKSTDIFPMTKLISKFGVSEFKKAFDPKLISSLVNENGELEKEKLATFVGINIVFDVASIVMSNVHKCEEEIYDFLESVSNLNREKLEEMSPAEFAEIIIDIIKKREFKDFFAVVSKLVK